VSLKSALHRLADAYRDGGRLALLFDYDGTLTPIVTHPALAVLPDRTRQLLQRFAERPRLAVGFISGRALIDLKSMVGLSNVIYSGTCGLEFESPQLVSTHAQAELHRSTLVEAKSALQAVAGRFAGAWIEEKPLGLTFHYRAVGRSDAPFLIQNLETALRPYHKRLTAVDACKAVEILPDVGCGKESAVQLIVSQHDQPVEVLYAGNDQNDANALKFVAESGGVAIGVGPSAPLAAQHRLDDVDDLFEQLCSLWTMLGPAEHP
jgi:trehalose-phosphatase